ncbi:MAG: rRNA maturation RNase YbeY [Anaerolineales bacterium]|jgi:probable rRNA maturation factor
MINTQIKETYRAEIDVRRLEKAAIDTLLHQKFNPNAEVAIVIEDDAHIQALNKQYRGIDESTDVLSFQYGVVDPGSGQDILGDILIAYPKAAQQAKENSHPVMDELILLVVHATLHLLGFEHETEEEKKEMWSVQDDILKSMEVAARSHD